MTDTRPIQRIATIGNGVIGASWTDVAEAHSRR
jgi:3-hydroxyacyl-CoA dehydrogenase